MDLWSEEWNDHVFEAYHVFTEEEIAMANEVPEVRMQTAAQEIFCEEKPEITKVEVSFETDDIIEATTEIENMYNVDMYSSDLVGLIGVPVEITTDSEFNEATITFTYDRTKLGATKEEDIVILWYDRENKIYEKMDTVVDTENCTVSCKTTHFSSYSAVDEAQYDEAIDDMPDYMADDHGNDEWQGEVITPEQFLEKTRAYNFSTDLSDLTAISNGKSLYVTLILEAEKNQTNRTASSSIILIINPKN